MRVASVAARRAVPRRVAALLAVAVLASCSTSGGAEPADRAADEAASTTTSTAPTTTTIPLPPGGRQPTARNPLRVLLAGDSLMADMALALTSTLHDGGQAVARLTAAPSIARVEPYITLWRQQLDQ